MQHFLRHARACLAAALVLNILLGLFGALPARAADEDGYDLWLRYRPLPAARHTALQAAATAIVTPDDAPTVRAAAAELRRGIAGMLGRAPEATPSATQPRAGGIILVRANTLAQVPGLTDADALRRDLAPLGPEGYLVRRARIKGAPVTLVAANAER